MTVLSVVCAAGHSKYLRWNVGFFFSGGIDEIRSDDLLRVTQRFEKRGNKMKKVLYGSTALVAAGTLAATPAAAEEGVSLGLGGYWNSFFYFGDYSEDDNDPRDLGNTGIFNDGEVHFKGKTTLDNGITFGVQVELEGFTSGDQIDENYAYIEGSFGRLVIGGENTAAYMMQYGAPFVGTPINSGWITSFIPPPQTTGGTLAVTTGFRTPALSTYVDLANDDHALNYFSPRFSGFQVGASYVPAATVNGEGKNFPVQADENTEFTDLISVGANFVESFGNFDVAVAAGYRMAQSDIAGQDDPSQISAGLNVGFAGFTVGASMAIEDSDRSTEGTGFDVGATYSTGPWSVGLTYFHSEVEGAAGGGDDSLDAVTGGISYAVGPGITASASIMWAEWDGDNADADGVGGIVGIKMGF
jgi:predicted porin